MAQQQLSTNTFTASTWIVNSDATKGTHTTLASALTSASSGDTILLQTSVTENPTLKAGVDIVAWNGSQETPSVTITGTCTLTAAGTVSITGIRLQTNSAALLAVTGSAASIINLRDCYLNCTNNTGITYSSSSGSSAINIYNCKGDIGTTGITLFSHSASGQLLINNSLFSNTGGATTASTISSGAFGSYYSTFQNAFTSSSTAGLGIYHSVFSNAAINTACFTIGGSGSNIIEHCELFSGTASTISISATASVDHTMISSTNTNAITGAGTINYSALTFTGSSAKINTTTQVGGLLQGGLTQAPSAGFIGERITSGLVSGVSASNGSPKNITSISITAGIWDVTGFGNGANTSAVMTAFVLGLSTTTGAFQNNFGDDTAEYSATASNVAAISLCVPNFRVTLTATTTYFLVGQVNFAAGTASMAGRISAVRVG